MKDSDIEELTRAGRASCAAGALLAVLAAGEQVIHVLALDRSDDELIADYGMLGLDHIKRFKTVIAKAREGLTCDTTRS